MKRLLREHNTQLKTTHVNLEISLAFKRETERELSPHVLLTQCLLNSMGYHKWG